MTMIITQVLKTPLTKEEWESGFWLHADESVVVEDYDTHLNAYNDKYKDIWKLYNGAIDENISKVEQIWFPVYEDRSHRNWPVRILEGYDEWVLDRNFFKDEWESGFWLPRNPYNRDLDVLFQNSYPLFNGKTDSIPTKRYYLTSYWIPCNEDRSPRSLTYVSAEDLSLIGVPKEELFYGFIEEEHVYRGKLTLNEKNLQNLIRNSPPKGYKTSFTIGNRIIHNLGEEGVMNYVRLKECLRSII